MRYIAEILIGKPLGMVISFMVLSCGIFFGVMFTVVEIIDIILHHRDKR